jgi:hypothetical protein
MITLGDDNLKKIEDALEQIKVVGARYPEALEKTTGL